MINQKYRLLLTNYFGPPETVKLYELFRHTNKHELFTNSCERLQSRRVCFSIESVGGSEMRHDIRDAQTTPTLNMSHHSVDWSTEKKNWPHLADLELPGVTSGGAVDLLLGTDVLALIVPREVVEGPPGTPWAVRTLLGWLVTGRAPRQSMYTSDDQYVHHVRVADERSALADLQNQVKKFWTTETFGTKYEKAELHSESDKRALSILDKTTKRVAERYETGLLWRDDCVHVTTDVRQWPAGGQQNQQVLIRPPEKKLCLQRYDQRSMDDLSRSPVPPATSALQRRSHLRRRFQPPPPLPTPCRRQRWHRASWRTSTTTTHGTPLASVTRGGPSVYGHSATLGRDSAIASCRTGVAGESGDETTGPGPPGLRTVLLPSPRAGRCQRRSEHFS